MLFLNEKYKKIRLLSQIQFQIQIILLVNINARWSERGENGIREGSHVPSLSWAGFFSLAHVPVRAGGINALCSLPDKNANNSLSKNNNVVCEEPEK